MLSCFDATQRLIISWFYHVLSSEIIINQYLLLLDWPCSLEWFSDSAMTRKLPPSWGMMLRHQVHLIMSNYSTHHGLQVYPLLVSVNPLEHSSKFSIKYTVHVDNYIHFECCGCCHLLGNIPKQTHELHSCHICWGILFRMHIFQRMWPDW